MHAGLQGGMQLWPGDCRLHREPPGLLAWERMERGHFKGLLQPEVLLKAECEIKGGI